MTGTSLFGQNTPLPKDDYAFAVKNSTIIDVLANDVWDQCDRSSLQVDTLAGTQLLYGSLSINSDKTFTYTPRSDISGIEHFSYTIQCGQSVGTAKVHIIVSKLLTGSHIVACPGSNVELTMQGVAGVSYSWYDTESGGSPKQQLNSYT
jgi:hypothetical protein